MLKKSLAYSEFCDSVNTTLVRGQRKKGFTNSTSERRRGQRPQHSTVNTQPDQIDQKKKFSSRLDHRHFKILAR